MKFDWLHTSGYFKDTGYTDDNIGMRGFWVNTDNLNEGEHLEINGMRLHMIFKYAGDDVMFFVSSDFDEFSMPVDDEFDVELVSTTRRLL